MRPRTCCVLPCIVAVCMDIVMGDSVLCAPLCLLCICRGLARCGCLEELHAPGNGLTSLHGLKAAAATLDVSLARLCPAAPPYHPSLCVHARLPHCSPVTAVGAGLRLCAPSCASSPTRQCPSRPFWACARFWDPFGVTATRSGSVSATVSGALLREGPWCLREWRPGGGPEGISWWGPTSGVARHPSPLLLVHTPTPCSS